MDKIKQKKAAKDHNRLRRFNKHIDFKIEGPKGNSRKRDTKIFCCKCGKKTTLPFKPRNPEVYCDDCFKEIKDTKQRKLRSIF